MRTSRKIKLITLTTSLLSTERLQLHLRVAFNVRGKTFVKGEGATDTCFIVNLIQVEEIDVYQFHRMSRGTVRSTLENVQY